MSRRSPSRLPLRAHGAADRELRAPAEIQVSEASHPFRPAGFTGGQSLDIPEVGTHYGGRERQAPPPNQLEPYPGPAAGRARRPAAPPSPPSPPPPGPPRP